MSPTPFTADEIRRGCPPGRTVTIRVREGEGPALLDTSRFVSCDLEQAVVERTIRPEDSEPVSAPQTITARWTDLQAHASFEEDRTMVRREDVISEVGLFECLRYTVTRDGGVADFWFAVELPGMPIKVRAPGLEMDMVENVG
jgi:hypothetical protein